MVEEQTERTTYKLESDNTSSHDRKHGSTHTWNRRERMRNARFHYVTPVYVYSYYDFQNSQEWNKGPSCEETKLTVKSSFALAYLHEKRRIRKVRSGRIPVETPKRAQKQEGNA